MHRLLVGLGNPGPRYEATRHNVGFEALDRILEDAGGRWSRGRAEAVCAETVMEGIPVTLMKPLTYMNLSGSAVAELVAETGLTRREAIVYYDDVALPLGTVRIRERGSDGGHRGLASILEALDGQDVPRVRIGIRLRTEPEDLAHFVLERFDDEERQTVDDVMHRVVEATRSMLRDGMNKAMSQFNSITA